MRLSTAYDAFWFLTEHPKLRCREARLITSKQAKELKLSKGQRLRTVKDEMPWRKKDRYVLHEYALTREAIECNLDIFYTKVDARNVVNDDRSKNRFIRCWLEFGPIKYAVSDGALHLEHAHDLRLDCGGKTFDEALIKLARLVRKHYGDIQTPNFVKP